MFVYLVMGRDANNHNVIWLERAFKDGGKAVHWKDVLSCNEVLRRREVRKCKECDGMNTKCPYYIEPFYSADKCEALSNEAIYEMDKEYDVLKVEVEE